MSQYDLKRLNAVVIDDSPFMLRLLKMILKSMGMNDVLCFRDPTTALYEIKARQPHLVITDMLMPRLDGARLTRLMREESAPVCFTPVLVLSGFTDKAHVLQASNAGAHYVLTKPISVEALHRRVVNLIEDRRPFVRTPAYIGPERRIVTRDDFEPERRGPASDTDVLYI